MEKRNYINVTMDTLFISIPFLSHGSSLCRRMPCLICVPAGGNLGMLLSPAMRPEIRVWNGENRMKLVMPKTFSFHSPHPSRPHHPVTSVPLYFFMSANSTLSISLSPPSERCTPPVPACFSYRVPPSCCRFLSSPLPPVF